MKTILIKKMEESRDEKGRTNPVGVWPAFAFICMALGILAPVLGMVFILIHAAAEGDVVFGEIGTVLMIASIPLLLAGSHFLDVWDKHRKSKREK